MEPQQPPTPTQCHCAERDSQKKTYKCRILKDREGTEVHAVSGEGIWIVVGEPVVQMRVDVVPVDLQVVVSVQSILIVHQTQRMEDLVDYSAIRLKHFSSFQNPTNR